MPDSNQHSELSGPDAMREWAHRRSRTWLASTAAFEARQMILAAADEIERLRGVEEQLETMREALVDISHASENPDAAPGHFGFLARRALGVSQENLGTPTANQSERTEPFPATKPAGVGPGDGSPIGTEAPSDHAREPQASSPAKEPLS